MSPQALQDCLPLVTVSSDQKTVPLLLLPYFLDQDLLLEIVEVAFDVFGHFDIATEPVDREHSFDDSNSKYMAILAIGALEGLISVVEEINRQWEDGVKRILPLENGLPLFFVMFVVDHADEVSEKREDWFLALWKIHARRGELVYWLQDVIHHSI